MPLFTLEYERGLVNCQGSLMEYWDITSGGVANHPGGRGGGESSSTSFSCGKSDMFEQDRFDLQF